MVGDSERAGRGDFDCGALARAPCWKEEGVGASGRGSERQGRRLVGGGARSEGSWGREGRWGLRLCCVLQNRLLA
eukprot:2329923-Rhodomonas_salina.2